MSDDVARLKQELETWRGNYVSLVERVREMDLAEADRRAPKPVEINYKLKFTQDFVAKELANHAEEYRKRAWTERKVFLVDHPPEYHEGGWPEGLTAETFVRQCHGLRDDGSGFADEPEPKPEEIKLSPWLEAAIERAKGGKS